MDTTRYGVERIIDSERSEHLAIFTNENAAMKYRQRERELDVQAVRDGWIDTPGKFRIVEINRREW